MTDALGPGTAGTTRLRRIGDASGTRDVTLARTDYSLTPVSSRHGAQIVDDGGSKAGYVNLRTFISTADPALRQAFAAFRAAGVANLIVDMRDNGGGLVSIADLMTNLLGANRSTSDVIDHTTFRLEKSANNGTACFTPQPESIAPTKVTFIGTGGTASASELVIAAYIPYLHGNAALIGTNTCGKPVGQIALDRAACDDRLRVIAFALQNSARRGACHDGLSGIVEASCRAGDDLTHPLGSPLEASTRSALDFLEGRSRTRIAGGRTQAALSVKDERSARTAVADATGHGAARGARVVPTASSECLVPIGVPGARSGEGASGEVSTGVGCRGCIDRRLSCLIGIKRAIGGGRTLPAHRRSRLRPAVPTTPRSHRRGYLPQAHRRGHWR